MEIPQVSALVTSLCTRCGLESHVSCAVGLLNPVLGSTGHSTVPFGPTPTMVGLLVSTWLIVWLAVLVFKLQSHAVHVLVIETPQVSALVTSLCTRCGLESHVSCTVGLLNPVVGSTGHSTVPFGPTPTIVGLVVSIWLIV